MVAHELPMSILDRLLNHVCEDLPTVVTILKAYTKIKTNVLYRMVFCNPLENCHLITLSFQTEDPKLMMAILKYGRCDLKKDINYLRFNHREILNSLRMLRMSLWSWKRSGWINLSLAIFLIMAVITSISSTGFRSGFKTMAPNFSFHGELYPEVGIFHFLLFCSAICGFANVALRYAYIMDQVQVFQSSINYLNKISVFVGIISFLGLILIASFSASLIEVTPFQPLGAYIFIGVGIIFTILQTVLTYRSSRYSIFFFIRVLLAITLSTTFVSSVVFIERSKSLDWSSGSNDTISSNNDTTPINNITPQFIEYSSTEILRKENLLISCILEWVSVIVYALFYLSFFQEFQTISAYIIMRPFMNSPTNDFRTSSMTVNERV